jgi:hypothetical protein
MKPRTRRAVALVAVGSTAYSLRPRLLHWAATSDEVRRDLPGDDLVPGAEYSTTRAITIRARPADVWPWLVQMGQGRGGFYSYDWRRTCAPSTFTVRIGSCPSCSGSRLATSSGSPRGSVWWSRCLSLSGHWSCAA